MGDFEKRYIWRFLPSCLWMRQDQEAQNVQFLKPRLVEKQLQGASCLLPRPSFPRSYDYCSHGAGVKGWNHCSHDCSIACDDAGLRNQKLSVWNGTCPCNFDTPVQPTKFIQSHKKNTTVQTNKISVSDADPGQKDAVQRSLDLQRPLQEF